MSPDPFSIRFDCLRLANDFAKSSTTEDVLLTALKFYNFVNGDFGTIPELTDKIKLTPRGSDNVGRMTVQITDTKYETAMLERIANNPDRRIFYIDVDGIPPEKVVEYLDTCKEKMNDVVDLENIKKYAGVHSTGVDYSIIKDEPLSSSDITELAAIKAMAGVENTSDSAKETQAMKKLMETVGNTGAFLQLMKQGTAEGRIVREQQIAIQASSPHFLFDNGDRVYEIERTNLSALADIANYLVKSAMLGMTVIIMDTKADWHTAIATVATQYRDKIVSASVERVEFNTKVYADRPNGSINFTDLQISDNEFIKQFGEKSSSTIIVRDATISTTPADIGFKHIHIINTTLM